MKISAYDEVDQLKIRERIQAELTGDTKRFRIPADRGDLTSVLYKIGDVVDTSFEENDVIYQVELQKGEYEKYGYLLEDFIVS
ncbi:hypothetical protein D1872_326140 [compost metagenome]